MSQSILLCVSMLTITISLVFFSSSMLILSSIVILPFITLISYIRLKPQQTDQQTIAFFHTSCDMGGGGERVLWTAIKAIQTKYPEKKLAVYIKKHASSDQLVMQKIQRQFALDIKPLVFIHLSTCALLDPAIYPRFTLILQSIGSMITATEALLRFTPYIFIDTVGFAFTYPIAVLFGSRVISYTHYPTISTNMIQKVVKRKADYNNSISHSPILSLLKVNYYRLFGLAYGLVVNSTWTDNHIKYFSKTNTRVVYPPCDVSQLLKLKGKRKHCISLAQFRPEKNHSLQLDIMHPILLKNTNLLFYMVGGCRNKADFERVEVLRQKAIDLQIQDQVIFKVNATQEHVRELLSESMIGLHTMIDEHFGISIVEYMASGVIAIANNSGGPKDDIVKEYFGERIGFRADTKESYQKHIEMVLAMSEKERSVIITSSKNAVNERFSDEAFDKGFLLGLLDCYRKEYW